LECDEEDERTRQQPQQQEECHAATVVEIEVHHGCTLPTSCSLNIEIVRKVQMKTKQTPHM
jgi:hypothetical protein